MRTVTAYEAKMEFSELLKAAAEGETITITKHGVPVAMLVPHADAHPDPGQLIEEWRRYRKEQNITLGDGVTIRGLIDKGRV